MIIQKYWRSFVLLNKNCANFIDENENQESKTLLQISSNEGRECGSCTKHEDKRKTSIKKKRKRKSFEERNQSRIKNILANLIK